MNEIKITVLLPVYNAAAYIAEAIDSVLVQTFSEFELLIINDGSTDETAAIIRSFSDTRIVLIEQKNAGVAAALNLGLKNARAHYVARFDADDICYPHRLQKQYDFLKSNPGCIVVGSAVDYVDAAGDYIFTFEPPWKNDADIRAMLQDTCPFIHSSVIYKKEIIAAAGYNVNAHSFEDHLLWQKIMDKGKLYNMPESLIKVRLNPGSLTMDERKRPAAFHAIKNEALRTGEINASDGNRLLKLIREQNSSRAKQAAYYNLLAKKFLWNNYQPEKARKNIKKALNISRFDAHGYLLYLLSYLPQSLIGRIYAKFGALKPGDKTG